MFFLLRDNTIKDAEEQPQEHAERVTVIKVTKINVIQTREYSPNTAQQAHFPWKAVICNLFRCLS